MYINYTHKNNYLYFDYHILYLKMYMSMAINFYYLVKKKNIAKTQFNIIWEVNKKIVV